MKYTLKLDPMQLPCGCWHKCECGQGAGCELQVLRDKLISAARHWTRHHSQKCSKGDCRELIHSVKELDKFEPVSVINQRRI